MGVCMCLSYYESVRLPLLCGYPPHKPTSLPTYELPTTYQDYPKSLGPEAVVGFSSVSDAVSCSPSLLTYSFTN